MIFTFLSQIFFTVFNFLLSIFPNAKPATVSSIQSGLAGFKTGIATANWIFPVDTFFLFIGLIFAIEGSYFIYRFYKWIATNVSGGFIK